MEKQEIEEKRREEEAKRREEEEKRRKEEEKKRDEELEKYKKMFDELMKKQESDNRAREEEEKKRRENLEKKEKVNQELGERKASPEINLSNSQVCNNEMKKCTLDIKEKIENFINEKFAMYEPIEYRKGLNKNNYYVIKVKIATQKYIYIGIFKNGQEIKINDINYGKN